MRTADNENGLPEAIRDLLGRAVPMAKRSDKGEFLSPSDRRDLVIWLRRVLVDRAARKQHIANLESYLLPFCHEEESTDAVADAVTRGGLAGLDDRALCQIAAGPEQLLELSAEMDADLPRAEMLVSLEEAKRLMADTGVSVAMLLGEEPLPAAAQILGRTRPEWALSMNEPLPAWRPIAPAQIPALVRDRRYQVPVGLWHWQVGSVQADDREAVVEVGQPSSDTLEVFVSGGLRQGPGFELTVAWLDANGRERADPCICQLENAIRLTAHDRHGPRREDRLRLTQRQVRDAAVFRGFALDVLLS